MMIMFLVAAAFPSFLLKTGIRVDCSLWFTKRNQVVSCCRFRFQILMVVEIWVVVSDTVWSHFGRTCYLHLQGRRKRSKKVGMAASSATPVSGFKSTWWHRITRWFLLPKLPPPLCGSWRTGAVAVTQTEGELSRSFCLPQDRPSLHLRLSVTAFMTSGYLDDADDVCDQSISQ